MTTATISHNDILDCTRLNLGDYRRRNVANLNDSNNGDFKVTATISAPDLPRLARKLFDQGLMHFFGFHFEEAAKCFSHCVKLEPDCALAQGMISLCHSPHYNLSGKLYYELSYHPAVEGKESDDLGPFPSQQTAEYHSRLAIEKVNELHGTAKQIPHVECEIIKAIRMRTHLLGIDHSLAEDTLGRPYSNALRELYQQYSDDPEVAYLFADSLMVLNAWNLYEYPSGRPLSSDVNEVQGVLEDSLKKYPVHPGLCHLYIHLSEMSSDPGRALAACEPLRTQFPGSGHLIHMVTHIDILIGDYESVVKWNSSAIQADNGFMKFASDTSGTTCFYFAFIAHDYHMLVYGAIMGGFFQKGMEYANILNSYYVNEDLFVQHEELANYLEAFSATDVHLMVRFGCWEKILQLNLPQDPHLMLYRTATMRFARAIAYASLGNIVDAKKEADLFDAIRFSSEAGIRTLHNNTVSSILDVEGEMLRGEICYREGKFSEAFDRLRKAVRLQDGLKYDEPWGVMQPVRHALGGLLFQQNQVVEAEEVFRTDLHLHPKNPWSLCGLISCLNVKARSQTTENSAIQVELDELTKTFLEQRCSDFADFEIKFPCECCGSCSSLSTVI